MAAQPGECRAKQASESAHQAGSGRRPCGAGTALPGRQARGGERATESRKTNVRGEADGSQDPRCWGMHAA